MSDGDKGWICDSVVDGAAVERSTLVEICRYVLADAGICDGVADFLDLSDDEMTSIADRCWRESEGELIDQRVGDER